MENTLVLTKQTFFEMLSELIKSGVRFTAKEIENKNEIHVIFTGGY